MTVDQSLRTQASHPRTSGRDLLRRVVRIAGWTSIVLGLLILGFVVQQLFVTTWVAQRNQSALTQEVEQRFATAEVTEVAFAPSDRLEDDGASSPGGESPATPTPGDPEGSNEPPAGRSTFTPEISVAPEDQTLLVESEVSEADPVAIITIPSIERLEEGWTVVEGVRTSDLKNGAGHMPHTPMPGQPGNTVISGHRTTYGAPFHELGELEPGDSIEVETAIGTSVYEVSESRVVQPSDVWVTKPLDGAWLTLTTCHPKFSSRQRLVVFAELVSGPNFEAIYA